MEERVAVEKGEETGWSRGEGREKSGEVRERWEDEGMEERSGGVRSSNVEEKNEKRVKKKKRRNCEYRVSIWWRSNRRVSTQVCSAVSVHRRAHTCGSPKKRGRRWSNFCFTSTSQTCLLE